MKRAQSVFGSGAERYAFSVIKSGLPPGWLLYPNLPLSQVVEAEKSEVSAADWDFYLKASVDFVLTGPRGELCLAVEFDGLAGGFSSGSVYRPTRRNAQRECTINFKMALCKQVGLPLYVISFDEIRSLSGDDSLCIVHSVIAQEIVMQKMKEKLRHWDEKGRGRGKSFEEILDDISDAEVALQSKYDPFRTRLDALWKSLPNNLSWSMKPLSRPDMDVALKSKVPVDSLGCRFTTQGTSTVQAVDVTVWVRNFAGEAIGTVLSADFPVEGSINPLRVAENAALYLGLKRVIELSAKAK
jgi:hypothetical protein